MKILVALDSFKGSLSAQDACLIVKDGILSVNSAADIETIPLADGGEGTMQAMIDVLGGETISCKVMGPLPDMQIDADFGWFPEKRIALVEMAKASGLPLLAKGQLDPLKTTTYGTGQLIKEAAKLNPERILVAVGGSATVDGGVGAAMALNWQFLDCNGNDVGLGGGGLEEIAEIRPGMDLGVPVEVLCDVENPLCGVKGAARVFAPQKGADATAVEHLETGLQNLSRVVRDQLGENIDVNKAGAAGGLSGGLMAFTNAKLVSGINTLIDCLSLQTRIQQTDCVITGEGCFDSQSLNGKVVSGVAGVASKFGKPIFVIAGMVKLDREKYSSYGIVDAVGCAKDQSEVESAMLNPKAYLEDAIQRFANKHFNS